LVEAIAPDRLGENSNIPKGFAGRPCRTDEAHRLPKSVAYISAAPAQVKAKRPENRWVLAVSAPPDLI
jgi:hypothetical protein